MTTDTPLPDTLSLVIPPRAAHIGAYAVSRSLPWRLRRAVGPFVFLDHFGPMPRPVGSSGDTRPHPHIGLSTVTYLFEGEQVHRDSTGVVMPTYPGDLNVMTAGRGVVHSERSTGRPFRAHPEVVHGLQFWLGLPVAHEDDAPSFAHADADAIGTVDRVGVRGRVLLGACDGVRSPLAHPSQPELVEWIVPEGALLDLDARGREMGVYVVSGEVTLDGFTVAPKHLAVIAPERAVTLCARSEARVMALGGPSLDGPRHMDWNFVSSSVDVLRRAKDDWKHQRFPTIPGDEQEFIPYPDAE